MLPLATLAPASAMGALLACTTVPLLPALANNPTHVFSVGYGLAAAAAGAACLAAGAGAGVATTSVSSLAAWGLVAYGVRLAAFLAWRQRAWPEWKERAAKSPEARAKNVLAPVLGCGVFYALMCSPALWALRGGGIADASALAVAGVAIQWAGLLLEAMADTVKSACKLKDKDAYVSVFPFSVVRHPNYAGEILHWVGLFLAGLPVMVGLGGGVAAVMGRLVPAALGLIGIVGLMLSVTPRLDSKQADKYGEDAAYKSYAERTKMLVPFFY